MQYLFMYLLTVLGSMVGETLLSVKMIKDIADAGYLIDREKLSESLKKLKETSNVDLSLNNKIIKFIPIVNLLNLIKLYSDYDNARETIITQFSVMGALKEMTDEEKREYSKKPTGFKAIKIDINRELKLSAPTTSVLELENGKIWYEKSDRNYNILKATGSAEDLSRFSQVNLIEDHIKGLMDEGIEVYGDADELKKVIDECDNYNQIEQRIKLEGLMQKLIKAFPELKQRSEISSNAKSNTITTVIIPIGNQTNEPTIKEETIEQESQENAKTLRRKL